MSARTYQPDLPIKDPEAVAQIRARTDLDWFHVFEFPGFQTPGFPYYENWEFVASILRSQAALVAGKSIFEPGCADGLWTTWLTALGASSIVSSDVQDREAFRLICKAYGLPVTYVPHTLSDLAPQKISQTFGLVCSLGLLYHVHDPLMTLMMYRRYLDHGGYLILETATINSDVAYMQYTGAGQIYGKEGGNQFLQSRGFLHSALDELGMDVVDYQFRSDAKTDAFGCEIGRSVTIARKTRGVGVHYYPAVLEQLGMTGHPFFGEEWYGRTV